MSRAVLKRAQSVIVASLLLQSLWGCAVAQDVTQAPWTRAAPMPTARSELAAAALDGRIYVAGGIAQWGTTAAFETYDPAMDRWEELPPLPEAVHHLAAAATDDRVYITGGYTDLLFSETTSRAWAYDPRARRWTGIADRPMPFVGENQVRLGPNHAVSGNAIRFDQGDIRISPDDGWSREMSSRSRMAAWASSWPTRRRYGYA